ncbi:EscI/YscI/HrpB family type III secretion system inner rod protein [Pseudoduganella namucuonensis]|uniref:Type III secretion basal body protein I, YscI, HrpB, PscI n=1 Tax=Pseudoduganella namucuonensis TaxID=1035707 RepID=A0A1I7LWJ1_9BURK|nr:EscI/YscI/HrpB family type III secretion system inner rod protein [Pseudoduganella namucuonensis]SFV13947.1 Type III secretion basal body protein I, YscI, HrpB, PscI [Pseudoduganella namucuonensis]
MELNTIAMNAPKMRAGGGADQGAQLKIDIQALDHSGSDQFRAALDRQGGMGAAGGGAPAGKAGGANSLGRVLAGRTTELAAEVKKDQQYVSKLLESATRSGDKIDLMRAMMALSDFQLRVQTISKTVSKAATSIDSLTKLQ